MKRILSLASILLSFSFITLPAEAATESYTLDPSHSYVEWHISHFGFSSPSGKWTAEGTLTLDEAKPKNSKINVTVPIDSLVTGVVKLDEHLKDKDFFDVSQYPTAAFVSDKVEMIGKNKAKVYGMLTVHGVSKPITLNVSLNKIGESPITHKKTAGFTATTTLKRSDFGISKYAPGLGDEVKINIEAEAVVS